tara:strand:+ start:438 stop:614 length:177 start_codon:yes stop_codon:yes gene_type:complete
MPFLTDFLDLSTFVLVKGTVIEQIQNIICENGRAAVPSGLVGLRLAVAKECQYQMGFD